MIALTAQTLFQGMDLLPSAFAGLAACIAGALVFSASLLLLSGSED